MGTYTGHCNTWCSTPTATNNSSTHKYQTTMYIEFVYDGPDGWIENTDGDAYAEWTITPNDGKSGKLYGKDIIYIPKLYPGQSKTWSKTFDLPMIESGQSRSFSCAAHIFTYCTPSDVYKNTSITCNALTWKWNVSYFKNTNANVSSFPANQIKELGKDLILPYGSMRSDGYVFANWNTQTSGKGRTYHAEEHYKDNGNLNLYAMWEKSLANTKFNIAYTDKIPQQILLPDNTKTNFDWYVMKGIMI